MPNRLKKTYVSIFTILKEKFGISPVNIIIDFEKGLLMALNQVFPETSIQGCVFHFSQAIWRKIQNDGLTKLYTDDVDFKQLIRNFLNVVYVPINFLHDHYIVAKNKIINSKYSDKLNRFIGYFENTYMVGCFNDKNVFFYQTFGIVIKEKLIFYQRQQMELRDGTVV